MAGKGQIGNMNGIFFSQEFHPSYGTLKVVLAVDLMWKVQK